VGRPRAAWAPVTRLRPRYGPLPGPRRTRPSYPPFASRPRFPPDPQYAEKLGTFMPISRVTIGSIEDLYGNGSVDYSKAEPFTCPTAPAAASTTMSVTEAAARGEKQLLAVKLRKPIGALPVPGRARRAPLQTSVDPAAPQA
jgi:hypothetical protein